MLKKLFFLFLLLSITSVSFADDDGRRSALNALSVDFPLDGGAMLSYTRSWRLTNYLDAGWVISGGQIQHDFDLNTNGQTYSAHTKAWVLPLTGPMVTLHYQWIGLAFGYAAFYGNTDFTVDGTPAGNISGKKKAWGSGLYSPLLVLDFYDRAHDLVFGFGLGGYFGTSYPTLTASAPGFSISTDESPINTLTFHLSLLWAAGRQQRLENRQKAVEDF